MQKYNIMQDMINRKLAVVIRGENITMAEKTADACFQAGIKTLELTFTVPGANDLLTKLRDKYKEDALIGAGTVLDSETARVAILAGASFIVSPTFDKATAKLCNRYAIPYIPGCMTINEMMEALDYGASIIKLFPGNVFSPSFIGNIHGPLPQLSIMPTGGITLENIDEWLNAGAVMVGVGGEITKPAKYNDYSKVEQLAHQFQQKVGES